MTDLIKLFVHKLTTDDIHPVTKKPIIKTSYHTEADGKGDHIKSIIGDGSGGYYAVKDANGERVMPKATQAMYLRANNKRLGNADLKKVSKRINRLADRIVTMRKQVAKLTGEELLSEDEESAITGMINGLAGSITNALTQPLSTSKDTKEEPDIF